MTHALVYDFDGTLARGNCAEHGLFPALGIERERFWAEVRQLNVARDGDEILTYLGHLAHAARLAGRPEELAPERLREHGRAIPLLPGVEAWFDEMAAMAGELDLDLRHHVVSSGLDEMIRGSAIGDRLDGVWACRYHYDAETGHAKWPAIAINYTTKTQFVFRIHKGIDNAWDTAAVNRKLPAGEHPVPFEHMIYIGDGDTDIPCMRLVREQGGCSIAVFEPDAWALPETRQKIEKLIAEDRVSYVVPADWRRGSQLDVTVRGVLRKMRG